MAFSVYKHLLAQGGANCAAAFANQVSHNETYTNQNLCNKQNDFDGDGIPAFNFDFNGRDWVYGITATQSGYQRITISNFAAPNGIRPFLGVFQGCPSNANLIQFRAPNMPYWTPATGAPLQIIIPVYQGQSYTIVVDGHFPPPPAGDFYSNCFSFVLQMQLTPFALQNGCSNIGFEDGTLNGWMATTGTSMESFPGFSTPHYNISNIGEMVDRHTVMTGSTDAFGGFPCVAPGMGSKSLRLGNQFTGAQAEGISRTFQVTAANSSFTYWYAVVFQDPNHEPWEQPFFRAMLRTPDGQVINCTEFVVSAAANLPGFFNSAVNSNVRYKPWSSVNIDLSNYIGQVVTIEFTAGDCSHGAHFGYAYIDCFCATSPFVQSDNTICPGENITLSVPNGYTQYLWNPGNHQTQSITVSPSVTTIYTAQVTSENGCVTEFQDTVFVAPAPVASFTDTPGGCGSPVQLNSTSQISSGSITQTQWIAGSSVLNGNSISYQFPSSGTFPVSLMVTSNQGCISTVTQNVSVPSCSLQANMANQSVCESECATLLVNVTDGLAPFNYNWVEINANGSNSLSVCPTSTTSYTVIITDATGSSLSLTATVTVNPKPSINLSTQAVSCNNANNGSATVNASGGSNFNYLWNTGETTAQVNNLSPGNHQVTVTNNFGCQSSQSFSISSPSALNLTGQISPATCGNANGSIQLTASGGTSPYQYRIGNGAFGTTPNFNNLSPGAYTLEVMDENSCSATLNLNVSAIPYLSSLNINTTNPNCSNQNGVVQINNSGFPFLVDIRMNNNLMANAIQLPYFFNNLSAGNHQLEVTDENGCSTHANVTLIAPTPITNANVTTTPATCGQQNACVNIQQVTGGTAPYQYAINGGAGQANPQFCNLANGNVQMQITDANQCTLSLPVQINAADGIQATVDITQAITCFGANDGAAQVNITSGQDPFTFAWSNGTITSAVNGLSPGTHQVSVTDGNGCVESFSVTLQEPTAISAQAQVIHQTCGLANASIQIINPTGGNGNFQFELNQTLQSVLMAENLNAGSYAIRVFDTNACQWDTTIIIQSIPFAQSIQLSTENPSCSDNNGVITIHSIDFAGYNPHISVNNSAPQALSIPFIINNLADGQFMVSIIDDNQCQLSESISLNRLSAPSGIVLSLTEATCNQPNASVEILQIQNGNGPYQFALNQGSYSTATTFSNLAPGAHLLSIKDFNACTTDTLFHIFEAPALLASFSQIGHVSCYGFTDGTLNVDITQGQGPFTALWNDGSIGLSRNQLAAGEYVVVITDANQCTFELQTIITQPEPLISTLAKVDAACGNANGEIQFNEVSGGTGTYLFTLNEQTQTSPHFINLAPGTYSPMLRDQNQCELVLSDIEILMISYPQSIDFQIIDESCSLSNGAVQISSVQGGIYPMQLQFNNQSIAYQGGIENFSGLPAGNYQIHLTDANQCSISQNITIINQAGPDSVETAVSPTTCNLNNGCIEIGEVYGGNGYNLYALNGMEFAPYPSFCQLASGDYTLTIKDILGCELMLAIFVPATIPVQADAQKISDVTCYGANNGQGLAMVQIGTGPFNYQWSNGEQHAHAQQLPPGTHTAYVTDIYGCIDTSMIQIAEPLPLHVQAYAENPSCSGDEAVLHAEAFGGVGNIQLYWAHNGSQSNSVIVSPLTTTSYLVTATDENACTVQTSVTQHVNPLPVADILSDVDKACAPACINFSLALPNQNIVSYQWLIADSLSSNNADPKFCFEQPGIIFVQMWLEDVNGCKNTAQVAGITEIYPTPEVNFSFNPSQPNILKSEVAFTQSSTHTAFWRWNFGDGSMAFMPNPVHSYQDTGRFEVCLEVMSAHGCMNDTCLDIYINPVFTFYMPNAFTPDGDGLNDVFKPEATFVKDIRWMVFNRWGEMIFESKDLNNGWDGFFKGREAQNDVYTWVATLRTFDDQIIRKEGMVKLLR